MSDAKEKYDGAKIRELIDSLMPTLHEHLVEEIHTLLSLKKYEEKVDLSAWFRGVQREIIDKARNSGDKARLYKVSPLHGLCHDRTFYGGANAQWPVITLFVRLLFTWVIIPKNKNLWRFVPCADGKPREMPFA